MFNGVKNAQFEWYYLNENDMMNICLVYLWWSIIELKYQTVNKLLYKNFYIDKVEINPKVYNSSIQIK